MKAGQASSVPTITLTSIREVKTHEKSVCDFGFVVFLSQCPTLGFVEVGAGGGGRRGVCVCCMVLVFSFRPQVVSRIWFDCTLLSLFPCCVQVTAWWMGLALVGGRLTTNTY